jgi:predicted ester cyclase
MRQQEEGAFAMSPDELKVRARRIAEELLTQGDLHVADELFAPACHHHASRPIGNGAHGMKRWVVALRRAFPDLRAIVEDEVAEGNRVAQRLTLGGTHTAALEGVPPNGQHATWVVVELLCVGPDGRFAAHWCVWDELGLLRQLGAAPTAAAGLP